LAAAVIAQGQAAASLSASMAQLQDTLTN